MLGLALAYAWAAYPYTAFALETNSNDSLVALACVLALLALTISPARTRLGAAARGMAVGLGTAAKFVPLALAPLFAFYPARGRARPVVFSLALLAVLAVAVIPFVPDGGLRELYDRTLGYQASRPSPFSIWGQDSIGWLHTLVKVAAAGLALGWRSCRASADARQTAALGAAVLIALQLAATHWFYLYVVWFVPFVLVVCLGAYRRQARRRAGRRAGARARGGARVRRLLLPALLLLVAGWAAILWVPPFSDDSVNDLYVYRTFAEPVLDGELPYRDEFFEYPPLAAPAIVLPGLLGTGEEAFRWAFAGWTFLLAAAVVVLCGALARADGRRHPAGPARGRGDAAPLRRDGADPFRPRSGGAMLLALLLLWWSGRASGWPCSVWR